MKILVTGGSGLVGRALVRRGVIGVVHVDTDVTDPATRDRRLAAHEPVSEWFLIRP